VKTFFSFRQNADFRKKCLFFRNFEDILVEKTLLNFNLRLKKQVIMSNTFQRNVNTFIKSYDLGRANRKVKKKLNLYYTRLIPFRVSRVSGAHLRGFAPRPIQSSLQRWRVIGNVWEI